MQNTWLSALVAWLNPSRSLAWEQASSVGYRGRASFGWDATFPWEDAADDELFLYAALVTAAHY
jgi:hypothetical protein